MVKQYPSGICVVFWTSAAEVAVQLLSWMQLIYICVVFVIFLQRSLLFMDRLLVAVNVRIQHFL
jgi:hypothetical protein